MSMTVIEETIEVLATKDLNPGGQIQFAII